MIIAKNLMLSVRLTFSKTKYVKSKYNLHPRFISSLLSPHLTPHLVNDIRAYNVPVVLADKHVQQGAKRVALIQFPLFFCFFWSYIDFLVNGSKINQNFKLFLNLEK